MIIHYNCTISSILLHSFLLIYHPYPLSFHEMIFTLAIIIIMVLKMFIAEVALHIIYIAVSTCFVPHSLDALGASTPLMEAAKEGHVEIVKYLIDQR